MKNCITAHINKQGKIIIYVSLIIISMGNIVTKGVNLITFIFLLFPLAYKFIYERNHSQRTIISFLTYCIPLFLVIIYYMLYALFKKFRYFTHGLDSILNSVNLRNIFSFIPNNIIIYSLCLFTFVLILNLIERFVKNNDLGCILTTSMFLFYSIFLLMIN